MKAVIYARFSSDRQNEDSIKAQVRACKDYAANNSLKIVATYADEAISGRENKTEKRKEYQHMLRDMKKHLFDIILIHKWDRIARSMAEHITLETKLEKEGIEIIAVAQNFGDSKEAKITKRMMQALSEYYSDNLASETRKGHKETALKALHNGGYPPFGYDVVDQRYVINDFEAAYVKKIFNCALDRKGYKGIIQEMKENGVVGKRGKTMGNSQINEILHNERYCGVYLYSEFEEKNRADRRVKPNAIRIENAIPAIIDKATFDEVQKIMKNKKQTGNKAHYLCSGLVFCGRCGAKMHVYKSTKKGHTYIYYRCSEGCGASVIKMEDVDKVARRYILDLLSDDTQSKIAAGLKKYKGHEKDRIESFNEAVKKRIKKTEEEYNNTLRFISRAPDLTDEIVQDLTMRLKELKGEIEKLENAEPPVDYTVDTISEWLNTIKTNPDEKTVHLLIEKIVVEKTEKEIDFSISSTLKSFLGNIVAGEGFEPTTSGL